MHCSAPLSLCRPTFFHPPSKGFLLYYHGDVDIIVVVFLLSSGGRGSTASTAAAEERQSRTRGLSRRRSQGGRGGGVGGGRGEGSHSGPDLAAHSQLATLVLWLSEDNTKHLFNATWKVFKQNELATDRITQSELSALEWDKREEEEEDGLKEVEQKRDKELERKRWEEEDINRANTNIMLSTWGLSSTVVNKKSVPQNRTGQNKSRADEHFLSLFCRCSELFACQQPYRPWWVTLPTATRSQDTVGLSWRNEIKWKREMLRSFKVRRLLWKHYWCEILIHY